ncbi:hypothetical protein PHYSODRAFT_353787 [Phytophthora sojae]|uniref:Uncharacterized protein n=1 Tax=Phytophthora sojae (strain P6497) TaxID=1094619 RepID=G4YRV6_PHYSP|nr:hypothetical protein PHYSODRAFT_353787 [Phytophthora sojae]EGZ22933.1 hypothetical protein PHYSODRAFT_353787 [Phytophthora sojae]|eukprot:XP_009518221.1 hypothetical protein PHYSODRAFT_353787 [Phytophthora sojae]
MAARLRIPWVPVIEGASNQDGMALIDAFKSHKYVKSELMDCTVCFSRYQRVKCTSTTCSESIPFLACHWQAKILTCTQSERISIFEDGVHLVAQASPRRRHLTEAQKSFCRNLAEHVLKPVRIRTVGNAIILLPATRLPTTRLSSLINCSNETTPDVRV